MSAELIGTIFQVCIIPLLATLTGFFVKWVNTKSQEIAINADDKLTQKYVAMLGETITNCVKATNQTYVNTLKAQGTFDAEAQKKALKKTCESVMAILSDEAKTYLTNVFGDLEKFILNKIEAEVATEKVVNKSE